MRTPTVYVPHCPTRNDPLGSGRVPTVDLTPAARFGTLKKLSDPQVPMSQDDLDDAMMAIEAGITGVEACDYIVAVGDPILIAAAIFHQHRYHGKANVLRWDRQAHIYRSMEVVF